MRRLALAVIAAATLTACSSSGSGGVDSSPPVLDQPVVSSEAPTSAAPAGVGSTVDLTTLDGAPFTVTLLDTFETAKATGDLGEIAPGMRLYAVQFEVANEGQGKVSEGPFISVHVRDSEGQSFDPAEVDRINAGPELPGTVSPTAGAPVKGWLPFEVPKGATITTVQWGADGGMGSTGTWTVS